MDFMNVLSLAIGMVTVYLVFALSVTAFTEAIAATLSSRGKWLLKGVASLYSKTTSGFDMAQARKVMAAPQIAYLHGGAGLLPSYVPAWTMLQAMLHVAQNGEHRVIATVADIRAVVGKMPPGSPIRVALEELLATGGDQLDDFRKRFEAWFTVFEAQLLAWYRQRTQTVVMVLSVALVAAFNLDTLTMVNQLSTDKPVRDALVKQATQLAVAPPAAPTGAASAPVDAAVKDLRKTLDEVGAAGLRVGWTDTEFQSTRQDPKLIVQKLLGLLLSALALSLGAPFWFDLLKGLVSIRSVGKNLLEQKDAQAAHTAQPK